MNYKPAHRNPVPQALQDGSLLSDIERMGPEFAKALPEISGVTPRRLIRTAMTDIRRNPELAECDRASLFSAIMTCAELGLEPGSGMNYVHLIPRENRKLGVKEVSIIVDYKGLIVLMERGGNVTVDSGIIYEKDHCIYKRGTKQCLEIEPYLGPEDPGEIIATFAIARYKDGSEKIEVKSRREIDFIRDKFQPKNEYARKYHPWTQHFPSMARKTAIRALANYIPKNEHVSRAIEIENSFERNMALPHLDIGAISIPAGEKIEDQPESLESHENSSDDMVSVNNLIGSEK